MKQAGEQTSERITAVTERASALTEAVRETLAAGRGASLKRAEQVARPRRQQDRRQGGQGCP